MAQSASRVDVWNRALIRAKQNFFVQEEDEATPAADICRRVYDDIVREVFEARLWPFAVTQAVLAEITDQSRTFDYADAVAPYDTFEVTFPIRSQDQLTVTHISAGGTETELDEDAYTFTPADAEAGTNAYVELDTALIADESVRLTVTSSREGWDYIYALPADGVTPIGLLYSGGRFNMYGTEQRIEFAVQASDDKTWQVLLCDVAADEFDCLEYVALVEHVPAWPRSFLNTVVDRLSAELAIGLAKDEALEIKCLRRYAASLEVAAAQAQNVGHELPAETPSITARG